MTSPVNNIFRTPFFQYLEETPVINPQKMYETAPVASNAEDVKTLNLHIISYDDFVRGDAEIVDGLRKALGEDGIVGIRGIPGYKDCTAEYIEAARKFSSLDPAVKQQYVPNREAGKWLGFETGKEKFKREDGTEVVDDAKSSYYAIVNYGNLDPEKMENVWPSDEVCDLKTPYLNIGDMMFNMCKEVLQKVGYISEVSGISLDVVHGVGRMLHYKTNAENPNPLWCGAHYDHGLFTALLPAFYYKDGVNIPEPEEAGLFVRRHDDEKFYKVVSDDPEVMLFQTGQFAQLSTNGQMKATEHRVHSADDSSIERYTMAVFISPENEATISSNDPLALDDRYQYKPNGEKRTDGLCTYLDWHINSINRYEAKT